jgi:hypothetical protein
MRLCSLVRITRSPSYFSLSVSHSPPRPEWFFSIWHFLFSSYISIVSFFFQDMPMYRCNVEKCKWKILWRYLSIEWTTFIHLFNTSNNSIFWDWRYNTATQAKSIVSLAWLTIDDTFQLSLISADDTTMYTARKWRISPN